MSSLRKFVVNSTKFMRINYLYEIFLWHKICYGTWYWVSFSIKTERGFVAIETQLQLGFWRWDLVSIAIKTGRSLIEIWSQLQWLIWTREKISMADIRHGVKSPSCDLVSMATKYQLRLSLNRSFLRVIAVESQSQQARNGIWRMVAKA